MTMALDHQEGSVELDTQVLDNRSLPTPAGTSVSINLEGLGGNNYQQLKPADGGIAAWQVLFAAFMFEALLWGMVYSIF